MGFTPVNVIARSQFATQPAGTKYSEGTSPHILPAVGSVLPPAEPKRCVLPGHLQHPVNTTGAQQTSNPWLYPQTKTRGSHALDLTTEYPVDASGRNFINGIQHGYVARPTNAEFDSLIDYIESLSSIGSSYGIVKIIPPRDRDLTFGLDPEAFCFHSERQCTSLLNAEEYDEISSSFMKALVRYMDVHRKSQKLPTIDKRPVDLYRLWQSVSCHGGYDTVGKNKMWARIGRELGYFGRVSPSLSTSLRTAYNKCIAPFLEYLNSHGVNIHAARLVKFGVVDGSFVPQNGVKVLPEGIIVDTEFSGTQYKVQRGMQNLGDEWVTGKSSKCSFNDFSGSAYNLRQFQQKADTIRELLLGDQRERNYTERAFWSVLERAEHVVTERGQATGEVATVDFLSKLPFSSNSALRYAQDGSEYLGLTRIEALMIFSCAGWEKSKFGEHKIVYNRSGAPVTWYSSPNCFLNDMELPRKGCNALDQEPGELIVIFPGASVSSFSHGFSLTESVLMFSSDWLTALPRLPLPFSFEQLLVTIVEACPERKLLVSAVKGLKSWLSFFLSLKTPNETRLAPQSGPKIVNCHETGAKMYLAWWETDVGPMSLSAGKGGTLITRADIPKYIEELVEQAETKVAKMNSWELRASRLLAESPRPSALDIINLTHDAPDAPETLGPTLKSLNTIFEKASEWNHDMNALLEQPQSTDESWRRLEKRRELFDCCLGPQKQLIQLAEEATAFAAQLDFVLNSENWEALESLKCDSHIFNGYFQLFQQLRTQVAWLSQTIRELKTTKPTLQKLEQLMQKAHSHNFDDSSPITLYLKELHSVAVALSQSLRDLLHRRVDEIADGEVEAALNAVMTTPVVVEESVNLVNFANFRHFVKRIENPSPDILQRPRLSASRRIALNSPLTAQAVAQADKWLMALGIDWNQLEVQARCLELNAQPPQPLMMFSIQALRQLPDQLQLLVVEPDNLEAIMSVVQIVQRPYAVETFAMYGFV